MIGYHRRTLRVEYEITPDDWAAFGEYHARTAPQMRRLVRRGVVQSMLSILIVTGLFSALQHSLAYLAAGAVVAVFWGWYWPRQVIANVRAQMARKNRPCGQGMHVMESLPDGLHVKCEMGESRYTWPAIRRVITTSDHVFVMLDDVQGYVIPRKRVITGELEQLADEMRTLNGQGTTPGV